MLFQEQLDVLKPIDLRSTKRERGLLVLHGFSSSPAVFRKLLPALTHYDAIVCPALPGHADSLTSFTHAKASDWQSAAFSACETLLKDYKTVDVLGLSLGGLLACELSQRLAIHHLYLLAPALALRQNITLTRWLAYALHALGFRRVRNHAGDLYTNAHSELTYRQLPIKSIIEILTLIQQFKFSAPRCPTDVFLGCYDTVVDSFAVERYFQGVSHSTIHWLKQSAHILPLDGDIDRIITCVNKNK